MRLLIAFVHREDAGALLTKLQRAKIPVTALESRGGFLRRGNATILTAVEDSQVDRLLQLLRETCRPRAEAVDTTFAEGGLESIGLPAGTKIPVGGATALLLEVSRVVKI